MRCFENFLKLYRNFRENLGKMLENFGNMDLYGVPSENIKKNSSKNQWKPAIFDNFHEFLANFYLKKRILIKIKTSLMEF